MEPGSARKSTSRGRLSPTASVAHPEDPSHVFKRNITASSLVNAVNWRDSAMQERFRMRKLHLRERLAMFLLHGNVGKIYDMIIVLWSLSSCITFVYETYEPNKGTFIDVLDWTAFAIFSIDYILNIYMAGRHQWTKYVLSKNGLVDLLSIIPGIFQPLGDVVGLGFLRVLRAVRILRILKAVQTWAERHDTRGESLRMQVQTLVFTVFAVIFIAAGLFLVIEDEVEGVQQLKFHQSLYFIVVTITTLGYGEITPKSSFGQMFVVVFILVAVVLVPYEASKVLDALALYSKYDARYKRKIAHVVIVGNAERVLEDFLDEFFHERGHGRHKFNVVILDIEKPTTLTERRILRHPAYENRVKWLQGTAMNDDDLERCRIGDAHAVFLFAAGSEKSYDRSDSEIILRTLAVRRAAPDASIYCQVYNQANKIHAKAAGANIVVCVNEMKFVMLAKSAVCPGLTTFVGNLLNARLQYEEGQRWVEEYTRGASYELYTIVLPKQLYGQPFRIAVREIYRYFGAILIGLKIRQRRKSNKATVILNPFTMPVLENWSDVGFVFAEDYRHAFRVSKWRLTLPDGYHIYREAKLRPSGKGRDRDRDRDSDRDAKPKSSSSGGTEGTAELSRPAHSWIKARLAARFISAAARPRDFAAMVTSAGSLGVDTTENVPETSATTATADTHETADKDVESVQSSSESSELTDDAEDPSTPKPLTQLVGRARADTGATVSEKPSGILVGGVSSSGVGGVSSASESTSDYPRRKAAIARKKSVMIDTTSLPTLRRSGERERAAEGEGGSGDGGEAEDLPPVKRTYQHRLSVKAEKAYEQFLKEHPVDSKPSRPVSRARLRAVSRRTAVIHPPTSISPPEPHRDGDADNEHELVPVHEYSSSSSSDGGDSDRDAPLLSDVMSEPQHPATDTGDVHLTIDTSQPPHTPHRSPPHTHDDDNSVFGDSETSPTPSRRASPYTLSSAVSHAEETERAVQPSEDVDGDVSSSVAVEAPKEGSDVAAEELGGESEVSDRRQRDTRTESNNEPSDDVSRPKVPTGTTGSSGGEKGSGSEAKKPDERTLSRQRSLSRFRATARVIAAQAKLTIAETRRRVMARFENLLRIGQISARAGKVDMPHLVNITDSSFSNHDRIVVERVPPETRSHIVVCAPRSCAGIHHLLIQLRAGMLPGISPVVILTERAPPTEILVTISMFREVFVVVGTSRSFVDLHRCSISSARKVIILSYGHGGHGVADDADGGGGSAAAGGMALGRACEDDVDSNLLFTLLEIEQNFPQTEDIIMEVDRELNMKFLNPFQTLKSVTDATVWKSPLVAAGSAFASTTLDHLLTQSFFDPNAVHIVEQVLSSESMLGGELPLTNANARLTYRDVPPHLYNRTFDDAFAYYLRQHSSVVLAIYRCGNSTDAPLPYIYTCPKADCPLERGDRLLVLGAAPMDEFQERSVRSARGAKLRRNSTLNEEFHVDPSVRVRIE